MFLFDTNIFLEILLEQEKSGDCKKLLVDKNNEINISDFSLHSIGVILFRYKKENIFKEFLNDIISKINIITLSKKGYIELPVIKNKFNLDFDDSYQYIIAKENNLTLITLDSDFKKVKDEIKVQFM